MLIEKILCNYFVNHGVVLYGEFLEFTANLEYAVC